jgi:hypothetical protein
MSRINPRGSKHVGENSNYILIYKIVHVIGLCCIISYLLSEVSAIYNDLIQMYHFTYLCPKQASRIVSVFGKRTSRKSDNVVVFP